MIVIASTHRAPTPVLWMQDLQQATVNLQAKGASNGPYDGTFENVKPKLCALPNSHCRNVVGLYMLLLVCMVR